MSAKTVRTILIIAGIIGVLTAVFFISRSLVNNSYKYEDVVKTEEETKEVINNPYTRGYYQTEPELKNQDIYSNRTYIPEEVKDEDYYQYVEKKNRENDLNMPEASSYLAKYDSLYNGTAEDYNKDIVTFCNQNNLSGIYEFLSGNFSSLHFSDTYLSSNLSYENRKYLSTILANSPYDTCLYDLHNLYFVGMIDNQYYVFLEDITKWDNYIIVKYDNIILNKSIVQDALWSLGEKYTIMIYSDSIVRQSIGGKTVFNCVGYY